MSFDRRTFLRYASLSAASRLAATFPFGAMNSFAQSSTSDYKALVCIFLFGGNDGNNTLVPFETPDYRNYASIRGPLALSQNSLLPVTSTLALHPSLADIQRLFRGGSAALLANVGTLVEPLSRSQYLTGQFPVPSNLFSHPDQQLEWENAEASGETPTGWGGRIADKLGPLYNPNAQVPMIASLDGDTLFCDGASSSPVTLVPGSINTGLCSEGAVCGSRLATAQEIVNFSTGFTLVQADNGITASADRYISVLQGELSSVAPLQTPFPAANSIALQLKQIAQIIQVRQALGVRRQIFFAGLGGFDTHSNQLAIQSSLLSLLGPAMASFYQATQELGLANNVTTFTMSDFSRAMQPDSTGGSDHGWGSHHIILGGAVHGGQIFGTYPTLALGGPNDSGSNGRWIPTTSVSQYAATLATWFGVQAADLPTVFPLLGNFNRPNLGFVG